jgi:CHAD domain-containing protein
MKKNKPTESMSSIQKAVIHTIERLQQHLKKQEDSTEYIHRIRVDIKRLRAWLRLLRLKEGGLNWKQVDQHLFEYAKQLGSTRDAQAIKDTFKNLNKYTKTKEELSAIIYVREQLNLTLINSSINWEEFKKSFATELTLIKQDFISFPSTSILKKGLKHTYSKAIHHGQKAFSKKGTYDDLHKLRKWVKYLNYQLGYLNKRINIKHKIDALGDSLGKAHDLIMIKEKLEHLKKDERNNIVSSLIDKNLCLILKNTEHAYKDIFNASAEKFVENVSIN